ncbi:MAG: hypothetical protein ACYCXW_18535 [Solirubrobacteraceae bacterium]
MIDPQSPQLTNEDLAALHRALEELRSLADHPIPAVRGGVRAALADVSQVLNAVAGEYEPYGPTLAP